MEEEHNFIPDYDDIIEKENMADGPPAAKRQEEDSKSVPFVTLKINT